MTEDTAKMLSAMKRDYTLFKEQAKDKKEWLEEALWRNQIWAIKKIEEYEGRTF